MKYFEFFNPVKICAGEDAVSHLNYELNSLGVNNPLILTDQSLIKLGLVKKVIKLSEIKSYNICADIPVDSGVKVVNKILTYLQEKNCDGIIAIGGGSVIDTAKGVKMAYARTNDLKKIMGLEVIKKAKELPFIVLPTTAGTGSECTNVAVIKDEESDIKMEFITPYLMPNVAIIDPILTETLPPKISASTGFDALVHAIEGYTCLQKNLISDAYALTSIKLLVENIEKVCTSPKDKDARLNMAIGSTLAGLCFGNSMVGAVHAIGHSLGGVCHIAHGDAMTILLPYVMEFNKSKLFKEYASLLNIFEKEIPINLNVEQKCDLVINKIIELREKLNKLADLPISLTQTNKYDSMYLDEIVQNALNDGAMLVNPVALSKDDVIQILNKAK